MSSDNKKRFSLKGSKENVRISSLIIVFAVCAVCGIILRCVQMAKYIDPETGFFTGGTAVNMIFYAVLAIAVLWFCIVSFLSADSKKIELGGSRNKIVAFGSLLMAFGFLFDSFSSFFSGVMSVNTAVDGYTSAMQSGTLPLMLQSLFAFVSCVYFFIFASDFSKGTAKAYKRKIIATAPVCWAGARLIHRFLRQISFVEISDLFLELCMIACMVMFFMAFAQVASGVYKDTVKWRIPGFGLSAALIAAILSISRLIFTFVGDVNSDHPFFFADFTFAIFILTLTVKMKEDSKTTLVPSAESETENG